jgi:hypothetical protein
MKTTTRHSDAKLAGRINAIVIDNGGFGRKMLIANVASELGCDIAGLKSWLLRAHAEGIVSLGRCDMVEAYDAAAVAASVISDGYSTFHFVKA